MSNVIKRVFPITRIDVRLTVRLYSFQEKVGTKAASNFFRPLKQYAHSH